MVAEPAVRPLTSPVLVTAAIALALLDHVTTRPLSAPPLASFGVAVSCTDPPAGRLAEGGLTTTEATGTGITVMVEVALFPSLVAVMVVEPAATPVTSPLLLTVATAEALLDHVTTRP